MNLRLYGMVVVTGLGLGGVQGCNCCHRACSPARPAVVANAWPAPGLLPPHPLTPYQVTPEPAASPPLTAPLQPPAFQAPGPPVQPPAATDIRGYEPSTLPQQNFWRPPAGGNARQLPEAPRLYPPQSIEPAPALPAPPSEPIPPKLTKPEVTEERPPSSPVGIRQFAVARDGVTAGWKPDLEGWQWLQANGYRTVLHLKAPDEDDAADRQVAERHKLKYLSLEVSPRALSRAVVDDFNKLVSDQANQPLFVYDKDGVLAGGLWYLHFRTYERDGDEAARRKAGRLGLRAEPQGAYLDMWLAIEKFLEKNQ